jgi:hypothetical protein
MNLKSRATAENAKVRKVAKVRTAHLWERPGFLDGSSKGAQPHTLHTFGQLRRSPA